LPWFQQFDPIPEGIEHVNPVETVEGLVRDGIESGCQAPGGQLRQAAHEKRRVRLPRRPKVGVNAKVDSEGTASTPHAATRSEICRLCLLNEAQNSTVEGPCRLVATRWHRELDVIKTEDLAHCAC
jgi:hypothetical protein